MQGKTIILPSKSEEILSTGNITVFLLIPSKKEKQNTAHRIVTAAQVRALKGISLIAVRNQVRKPVAAIASTLEKIHPLSSKRQNSLPVTGIAANPITPARSHQVQKVHTSPFSKNADRPSTPPPAEV